MPPGWLIRSAIFPDVWFGPKTSFTLWSSLFVPYSKGSPVVIAGTTGVYLSRVTWCPTVHSGWWLPAPDGCLDQTCYLWWSMPEISAVYNSPLQTWCQSYIWWLWPAALHKISRTCQESIKESLSKHLHGWKYAYYNFTSRFPGQCEEQRSSHLYVASDFTSLDAFRYYAYTHAIAKKSVKNSFNLATLPPTSAAAKQHITRTYLQVQQWTGNELEPTDWGWRVYMDTLIPVPTDQPPAPERLLNLVSCKCKTGCSRGCGYRRVRALCSPMCANCMGITCTNTCQDSEVYIDDIYLWELVHNRTTKHVIPFSTYIGTVWYVPSWAIDGLTHVIVSHH